MKEGWSDEERRTYSVKVAKSPAIPLSCAAVSAEYATYWPLLKPLLHAIDWPATSEGSNVVKKIATYNPLIPSLFRLISPAGEAVVASSPPSRPLPDLRPSPFYFLLASFKLPLTGNNIACDCAQCSCISFSVVFPIYLFSFTNEL